jgi:hypothetical protein
MSNPLCHFELMTGDAGKCQKFYETLFRWTFDNDSLPGYTLIHTGSDATGGIFARPAGSQGACLNVYFKVTDIEATLKNVSDNGGKVLVPKTAIPSVGHFAMFADPEGVTVGIMQPEAH